MNGGEAKGETFTWIEARHVLRSGRRREVQNEGEITFDFESLEGHRESFVLQIVEVNKELCAVSYLVDQHNLVIFDKDDTTVYTHRGSSTRRPARSSRWPGSATRGPSKPSSKRSRIKNAILVGEDSFYCDSRKSTFE